MRRSSVHPDHHRRSAIAPGMSAGAGLRVEPWAPSAVSYTSRLDSERRRVPSDLLCRPQQPAPLASKATDGVFNPAAALMRHRSAASSVILRLRNPTDTRLPAIAMRNSSSFFHCHECARTCQSEVQGAATFAVVPHTPVLSPLGRSLFPRAGELTRNSVKWVADNKVLACVCVWVDGAG